MATADIPLTTYFSPCFQFDRFRALRAAYGEQEALSHGRFRREREAWVAAAFLMGYGELTERFWWLTLCPDISPGIIAIAPRQGPGGWGADRLDLAIVEHERHASAAGVAAAIERKLRTEAHPADARLVCYVRDRSGAAFDTEEAAAQVQRLAPPVAEVWLVGSVDSDQPDDYVVSRLHPARWERRLGSGQHCAETPQLPILDTGQGADGAVKHGFMAIEVP